MFVIIFAFIMWNFIAMMILAVNITLPFDAKGFEFVNPVYIYRHCRVNIFGAFVLMILMSLICPIGTICYWIYKLCTVGRKNI